MPPVATHIPADEELFQGDKINVSYLRDHFVREGRLNEAQMLRMLQRGTRVLAEEENLLTVAAPIIICGDIHGQFYDLMKLFEVAGGEPPTNKFLFLGDYVDRGYFSLECFVYLLALKINYPEQVLLLRGNHECRHLTKHFTFRLECTYKCTMAVYDACMKAFDALPMAALVNNQYFCVHGGISPQLKTPQDVNSFDRFQEPPKSGLMCDLLWTDPTEDFGLETSKAEFTPNRARGCAYRYSYHAVGRFLATNGLLSIIRGHEAQDAGYRLYRCSEKSEFPALITLFSAPNYVDVYNNKAAIIKYDGDLMNIRQFNCSPHPYYLPKFMNVFDWSMPFVGEKVADLLMAVLNVPHLNVKLATLSAEQRRQLEREKQRRQNIIKEKIRAIARVNKMFATVRDERETLTEFMNVTGATIVPAKYLTLGGEELRRAIRTFEEARHSDSVNEMLPDEEDPSDAGSVFSLALSSGEASPKLAEMTPMGIRDGEYGMDRAVIPPSPPPKSQEKSHGSPRRT